MECGGSPEMLDQSWSGRRYLKNLPALLHFQTQFFEAVLRKDPTSVFARVGRSVACLQIFSRLHSAAPEVQLGA